MRHRRLGLIAWCITGGFCIIMLAGCAQHVSESAESSVRQRAQGWLDALMDFDTERMFTFTSPAYRSAHSAGAYYSNYAGRSMWRSASVEEITCNVVEGSERCKVEVEVTYRGFSMRDDMTTSLQETWFYLDGEWYTQPRK